MIFEFLKMNQTRDIQFGANESQNNEMKLVQSANEILRKSYPSCFCKCGVMLKTPIKLNPCGHRICHNCAKIFDSCPFCHSPIDYKKEDQGFAKELQEPNYKCPNSSKANTKLGCRFSSNLERVGDHITYECPWTMLVCPNAKYGCREQLPRIDMMKHVKGCIHRPSFCKYCGQEVSNREIYKHEKECQTRYSKCSFCGEMILKSKMVEHMEHDCGKKPTVCPITYCECQLKKGELQSHLMADGATLKRHNQALSRLMIETAGGIEEIRNIISDLRNSVIAKRQRLQQLDEIIAEASEVVEGNGTEEDKKARQSCPSSPTSPTTLQDFAWYDQSEAFGALQRRFEDVLARRDAELTELELAAALEGE